MFYIIKMFTQTARELERDGIIKRHIYPVVPPKVEYELTGIDQSVLPIVLDIAQWGIKIASPLNQKNNRLFSPEAERLT